MWVWIVIPIESLSKPTPIYISIAISWSLPFRERKRPTLLPQPVAAKGQASAPPRNNPQAILIYNFICSPTAHKLSNLSVSVHDGVLVN